MGEDQGTTSRIWSEEEIGCSEAERFEIELEFVQALASPMYLRDLAQKRRLLEPAFAGYLKHLQYWHRPEYARFLVYPQCLEMLRLLQHKEFRQALCHSPGLLTEIELQQKNHWRFFRTNRMREQEADLPPSSTAAPLRSGAGVDVAAPASGDAAGAATTA